MGSTVDSLESHTLLKHWRRGACRENGSTLRESVVPLGRAGSSIERPRPSGIEHRARGPHTNFSRRRLRRPRAFLPDRRPRASNRGPARTGVKVDAWVAEGRPDALNGPGEIVVEGARPGSRRLRSLPERCEGGPDTALSDSAAFADSVRVARRRDPPGVVRYLGWATVGSPAPPTASRTRARSGASYGAPCRALEQPYCQGRRAERTACIRTRAPPKGMPVLRFPKSIPESQLTGGPERFFGGAPRPASGRPTGSGIGPS